MVRAIRRSIAKEIAREIGMPKVNRKMWAFWKDVRAGSISKTKQYKAIERVRTKRMREAMHTMSNRHASLRRIFA